jgi:nucleoporin NUP82
VLFWRDEARMPKVKCYSAAWLSKNAPGHQLFEPSPEVARSRALASPYAGKKTTLGPRRTIARRGTEVFVAVGKEIRWGDLAYIKEEWSSNHPRERRGSNTRIKREDTAVNMEDIPSIEAIGGLRVSRATTEDVWN